MSFDFQAVLLDMDGVVLDSMQRHASLWQEILANEGFSIDLNFILHHEGALGPEVLADLWASQGNSGQPPVGSWQRMQEMLDQQAEQYIELHADEVKPFPGVRGLLGKLRARGVPVALVTSSRRSVVERSLPPDIAEAFAYMVTAEDVGKHKPHPDPYLTAARALGVEPGRCLVVENAPAGIESARAAGATCFAVCTTLQPPSLSRAHRVFDDLEQMVRELDLP